MTPSRDQPSIQLNPWLVTLVVLLVVGSAAVLYFFNPAHSFFYPRCLLKATTGLDCTGCGGLRATHQLLRGNVAEAFSLNPLLVITLPFFGLMLSNVLAERRFGRALYPKRLNRYFLWSLLVVGVIFTIIRNLPFPAVSWMSST